MQVDLRILRLLTPENLARMARSRKTAVCVLDRMHVSSYYGCNAEDEMMFNEFFVKGNFGDRRDPLGVPVVLCFRYVIVTASQFGAPVLICLAGVPCAVARKVEPIPMRG